MFKRLLDPKTEKRPVSVLEVNKYLEDRWLAKLGAEKAMNGNDRSELSLSLSLFLYPPHRFDVCTGGADERDELCPSMYSFHSSLEEKNQLLHTLTTYGIETTVDRAKKKDRIREWIQASAIVEEYEEDESDLNEDIRVVYEDEDEEPSSMKGRHFPETRPVVRNETRRHKNRAHGSSARKRQPIKRQPTERKIPFAPQVAEERETIARFASFPNGDPNLALLKNGTSNDTTLSLKTEANVEDQKPLVNGQMIDNSPTTSLNVQDESILTNNGGNGFKPNSQEVIPKPIPSSQLDLQDHLTTIPVDNASLSKNPQLPNRKHRSQTAPFPASPVLNGSGGSESSARRSQSAVVLANSTQQPDRSKMGIGRSVERSVMPVTNGQSPVARGESSTPRVEHRSATQSMSRVENASVAMPPIVARVENQSNVMIVARNEKSGSIVVNPHALSAASHLVMQSFNAIQGINNQVVAGDNNNPGSNLPNSPRNSSPSSTPSKVLTPKNSPTTTPARTCTPPKHKGSHRVEESVVYYGKDPFEHYGIAQGAILRDRIARRGSMESENRSVSNWGSMFDFGFAWHWRLEDGEVVEGWRGLRMGRDTVHRVLVWPRYTRRVSGYVARGGRFGGGEIWSRWGIGDWYYTYWRSLMLRCISGIERDRFMVYFELGEGGVGERDILRRWPKM